MAKRVFNTHLPLAVSLLGEYLQSSGYAFINVLGEKTLLHKTFYSSADTLGFFYTRTLSSAASTPPIL